MWRLGIALILSASVFGARLAHADFQVAPEGSPPVVSDTPHVDPEDNGRPVPLRPQRIKRPHVSIINVIGHGAQPAKPALDDLVRGFGTAIPLSFACRQVVPASIRVVYGDGVDPSMPVSWTGGRPWAAIMRDALAPAGLTLIPQGRVVEIRR